MIIDLFNFKSNSSDLSLFRTNKQSSISRKLFFSISSMNLLSDSTFYIVEFGEWDMKIIC